MQGGVTKPARSRSLDASAVCAVSRGIDPSPRDTWEKGTTMKTSLLLGTLFALVITTPVMAAITEEPVTYKDGETTLKGFVVYDTAKTGKRPGIVIVHEWWGITKQSTTKPVDSLARATPPSSPTCMAMPRQPTTRRTPGRS